MLRVVENGNDFYTLCLAITQEILEHPGHFKHFQCHMMTGRLLLEAIQQK